MKRLYRMLFYVGLLLTLASCIIPAQTITPIDRRLLIHPEKWEFTFDSPDHRHMGLTEEQSKDMLLIYLRDRQGFEVNKLGWLTAAFAVTTLFSLVGWRREMYLGRKA